MYDVAVIGAGPAGSHVAGKLAGTGHKVVVLEQRGVGEKPCCTGIISRECAHHLGIDEKVVLRHAKSVTFYSPSRNNLRLSRPDTQAYIVDRPAFDRSMAERAQAQGAEFQLKTSVENITIEKNRVLIDAVNGKMSRLEARAAVIATGFGSTLVKKLGLGTVSNFAAGAQAEVNTGVDEVEVYFGKETAPGFFAWLVPTAPGKGLAGLFSKRSPGVYIRKFLSSLAEQGKIAPPDSIRFGAVPLRPLSRTYAERLLVVGDAAGQVKPTTGGGIYFGLLCGDFAASTLDFALKADNLSARALSNYERDWKKKLGRELSLDYYGRLFFEHLNDKQIERLFNIVKTDGLGQSVLREDVSFDFHGTLVMKALKHNTMSTAIKLMKLSPISRQLSAWSKG